MTVKEIFEKVYGGEEDYKLIKLWSKESIGHEGYAISLRDYGIIVEFSVGSSGIYDASSKGDLLSNASELERWIKFLNAVKKERRS